MSTVCPFLPVVTTSTQRAHAVYVHLHSPAGLTDEVILYIATGTLPDKDAMGMYPNREFYTYVSAAEQIALYEEYAIMKSLQAAGVQNG